MDTVLWLLSRENNEVLQFRDRLSFSRVFFTSFALRAQLAALRAVASHFVGPFLPFHEALIGLLKRVLIISNST